MKLARLPRAVQYRNSGVFAETGIIDRTRDPRMPNEGFRKQPQSASATHQLNPPRVRKPPARQSFRRRPHARGSHQLGSRARRVRHNGHVTMALGGSAQLDPAPGSAAHRAGRQFGVTAWKTGACPDWVRPALRSATNTRVLRTMAFWRWAMLPSRLFTWLHIGQPRECLGPGTTIPRAAWLCTTRPAPTLAVHPSSPAPPTIVSQTPARS